MSARYQKYAVGFVFAICLGIMAAEAATAMAQGPGGKLTRKTYNVSRLVFKGNTAALEQLITEVVEPRGWMMVGGQGSLQAMGKGKLVVTQTADAQKQVGDLLAALEKLPPPQKKENAKSKGATKGVLRIPVGAQEGSGETLVVYSVRDLMDPRSSAGFHVLIAKICSKVAPDSWVMTGGNGAIEFYPMGGALVVRQTKAVHEQLFKMLEKMYQERMNK